jgi:hypothetical protein
MTSLIYIAAHLAVGIYEGEGRVEDFFFGTMVDTVCNTY